MLTPIHVDIYRYYVVSQSLGFDLNTLLKPRPLSFFFLQILGLLRLESLFLFALNIPAILVPYFLFRMASGIQVIKRSILNLILISSILYVSPHFFTNMQLDSPGMLATLFAIGSAYFGLARKQTIKNWAVAITFLILSILTKPIFPVFLIGVAIYRLLWTKRISPSTVKSQIAFLFCSCTAVAFVYFFDKFNSSPFLADSKSTSPYAVVVNPIENAKLFGYYVYHSFDLIVAIFVGIGIVTRLYVKDFLSVSLLLGSHITIALPLSLLVNRPWESYSWYLTLASAVYLTYCIESAPYFFNQKLGLQRSSLAVVFCAISVCLWGQKDSPQELWNLSIQQYNRNVLGVVRKLDAELVGEILVEGLKGPYHPFKNTSYIKLVNPKFVQFDVLLNEDERAWNDMSVDQSNGKYPSEISTKDYTTIIVLKDDGTLEDIVSKE